MEKATIQLDTLKNSVIYQKIKLPLIIAHRGANSFAPENSLKAFEAALNLGCDGIEMDLRYTASGDVVVFHDRNLYRMTGVRGKVQHLALSAIQKYFLNGTSEHRIPTLQEALDLIRDRALIVLDVKKESFRNNGFEEKICQILKDFKLVDNVVISSFNPFVLKKISHLAPQFHLGFIFRSRSHVLISNGTPLRSLHARYRILSNRYVRSLHEQGYRIYAWTIDKADQMWKAVKKEVDGIITNKPELFYQSLPAALGEVGLPLTL